MMNGSITAIWSANNRAPQQFFYQGLEKCDPVLLLLMLHCALISEVFPLVEILKGRVEREGTLDLLPHSQQGEQTLEVFFFLRRRVNLVIVLDQVIGETP